MQMEGRSAGRGKGGTAGTGGQEEYSHDEGRRAGRHHEAERVRQDHPSHSHFSCLLRHLRDPMKDGAGDTTGNEV